MIELSRVYEAQKLLVGVADRTAIITAAGLVPGADVLIKAENLQRTGSFKIRGAYFRIANLTQEEKARGVIACSAGNHAQGVALSAAKEGIKCVICMPEGASLSKIERTRSYGAEVVLCPGVFDDAFTKAKELAQIHNYTFVHPFDDEDVITGQATTGIEILDQVENADIVLVPVGGGGLLAGVGFAIKSLRPECLVYGVEAAGAASMKRSLEARSIVTLPRVATIADGIAIKRPSDTTFALCRQYSDGILTVSESEISSAILTLLEDYKIVSEGAGAVAVAAAMYGKLDIRGKRVVCIVSGGNVDVNIIERIIASGLMKTGRAVELTTIIDDKPRQLRGLLDIISETGANILTINHDRDGKDVEIGKVLVEVKLETRGSEHIEQVRSAIEAAGYMVK